MKFRDIPKFPFSAWRTDQPLDGLDEMLKRWDRPDMGSPLILNPEWQRGHVWTKKQQTAFMEYFLKGGTMGRAIYFNCSTWSDSYTTPTYCVDGLQRITAAIAFLNNEIKAFGFYKNEFEDKLNWSADCFHFHMLKIKSKKELLRVYIDFNSGGTPHNPKELKRVQEMIDNTAETDTL